MKKTSLFLAILSTVISTSAAQDTARKSNLSMNLGLSFPHGDYWSTNFNNSMAGYATQGIVLDISYEYQFHPTLGFTALLRSMAHGVDGDALARDWSEYLSTSTLGTRAFVDIETGVYSVGGFMAGMYANVPVLEYLKFQPHLLLGLASATLPYQVMEASASTGPRLTTIRMPASTLSFAWMIGASAQLELSRKVFGRFCLDAFGTNSSWQNVESLSVGHTSGTVEKRSYDYFMNTRTLNLSAGLGIRF